MFKLFKRLFCKHNYIETETVFQGIDITPYTLSPCHIHSIRFVCTKCGQKAYRQAHFPLMYSSDEKQKEMWADHFGQRWPVDPITKEKCFTLCTEYKNKGINLKNRKAYDRAWESNWKHICQQSEENQKELQKISDIHFKERNKSLQDSIDHCNEVFGKIDKRLNNVISRLKGTN